MILTSYFSLFDTYFVLAYLIPILYYSIIYQYSLVIGIKQFDDVKQSFTFPIFVFSQVVYWDNNLKGYQHFFVFFPLQHTRYSSFQYLNRVLCYPQ